MNLSQDRKPDFILKISINNVIVTANNVVHRVDFSLTGNAKQNFTNLAKSIKEVVSSLEKKISRHLKIAKVVLGSGFMKPKNIKILKMSVNDPSFKGKLENHLGSEIVNFNLSPLNDKCCLAEVLTVSKKELQIVLDILFGIGIEVSDIRPDFILASEATSNFFNEQEFLLMKFSEHQLEYGFVQNGIISKYKTDKTLGSEGILKLASEHLGVCSNIILKIASFYNTTSKIDRLKTYYEREEEDYIIGHLITDSAFTRNLQHIIKQIATSVIGKAGFDENINLLSIYYESDNCLKIHHFLPDIGCKIFEFKHENLIANPKIDKQSEIIDLLISQVKYFFHLTY